MSKKSTLVTLLFSVQLAFASSCVLASDWFEKFKQEATDKELYTLLYAMPKGGDLHHHISGSALSQWWYQEALKQGARGYYYYTKVTINNCREYGGNEFSFNPYLMLFTNILSTSYQKLSECEKAEYKPLDKLNEKEKQGWLNSIRLDKAHEGRDEFFQTHWQRINELTSNPYLLAEILVKNMKAFGDEGLLYMEPMLGAFGYTESDGTPISADDVATIYRERLQQADAKATGVTVRLQESILRFSPLAEQQLRDNYAFVSRNDDLYVAVNMVGREDNDKGHPMRFLPVLRKLRQQYNNVMLSIHAGEVDEPNHHIRDTLLLGADRIGHGLNLITDNELMRQMRHGPYLIEINLISNLLLEYIDDYNQHPFPEYLRTGIPVALSTDDRGMWDSNLTDEFFVATKEFNLSWAELNRLGRNSITHSFLDKKTKASVLARYQEKFAAFEEKVKKSGVKNINKQPVSYQFTCRQYQLCLETK